MSISEGRINSLIDRLQNGIIEQLVDKEDYAFIEDPISKVVRTRVAAEVCSALVRLHGLKSSNHKDLIKKLTKWIILNQNEDGSWNEKHINYDKPSSVFTAISALALLDVSESSLEISIPDSVFNGTANFLMEQEISNGYFRKSEYNHLDTLNVDAMVAAFLVRLGTKYNNKEFLKAGKRALSNICAHQFMNGDYPYGGPTRAYPFKHHFYIPCIHYQTVTLYYLMKSLPFVKSDWLEYSINCGTKWLLENQNLNGHFNWKKSGLNFALYLSATYAFAIPLYLRYAHIDKKAEQMIPKSLEILEKQMIDNILLRWEKGTFKSIIVGILESPSGGSIGNYPISFKILRTLHRIQREISRARVSQNITVSKLATRSKGYSAFLGTVESDTNYPDLYMTTEALDALSFTLTKGSDT